MHISWNIYLSMIYGKHPRNLTRPQSKNRCFQSWGKIYYVHRGDYWISLPKVDVTNWLFPPFPLSIRAIKIRKGKTFSFSITEQVNWSNLTDSYNQKSYGTSWTSTKIREKLTRRSHTRGPKDTHDHPSVRIGFKTWLTFMIIRNDRA